MCFTILEFEDGLQLVPSKWLVEEQDKCFYPPYLSRSKIDQAIECEENPGKVWMKHNVLRIFGTAATYKQGIKKLQLAIEFLEIDNEVELFKEPRRKRTRKENYADESDNENHSLRTSRFSHQERNMPVLCAQPVQSSVISPLSITSQQVLNESVTCSSEIQRNLDHREISISASKENQEALPISGADEERRNISFEEKVLKKLEMISCELKEIKDYVANKEKFTISMFNGNSVDVSSLKLPIQDDEELGEIEKLIKRAEIKEKMIEFLSRMGGASYKDTVYLIMKRILSKEMSQKYSLFGRKGKRSFRTLNICGVVICAVMLRIKDVTISNIEKRIGTFLATAGDRIGGRQRGRQSSKKSL